MPLRAAMRPMSAGGAVPSRWTCSSAIGTCERDASSRSASVTVGRAARRARRRPRRPRAAARRRARRRPRRAAWTTASGRPPGPTSSPSPATSIEADGVVDGLVLALAAAAELEDGEAEVARRRSRARGRAVRGRPRAPAARAAGGGPGVERSAGPPSAATIAREALGRGAAGERLAGGGARLLVGVHAAEPSSVAHSASVTSTSRASAPRGSGERVDAPRAPRRALPAVRPSALVHVGEQRLAGRPVAAGDVDERPSELGAALALGQERARAGLDVHDERVEPGRELLGEDRGDDQRDRLDGRRSRRAARRGGGRRARGRRVWPTIAQPASRDGGAQAREVGRGVVAGDRVELVERAARVAEAAAGDHRHRAAAGGEDRREQQRDLVADAAGGVLVEHRARQVASPGPSPRARHRAA